MKIRLGGRIVNADPRLSVRITRKRLIFDNKGRQSMTLDSGFTGSVAIPEDWADRLDLRYAGIQSFELANRQIVEFPTYLGFIQFGQTRMLFEFIVTGEALLGMEFFEKLKARVLMDCRTGKIVVEGELQTPSPRRSR